MLYNGLTLNIRSYLHYKQLKRVRNGWNFIPD